jgi:hypothetical protein
MSTGNYISPFLEQFHSILMVEFHNFRREKVGENEINVMLDGGEFNDIIASAKRCMWDMRPESKEAGYVNLDKSVKSSSLKGKPYPSE